MKVSVVDHPSGECLRCKVAAKSEARQREVDPFLEEDMEGVGGSL